jgi:hypothetical protein
MHNIYILYRLKHERSMDDWSLLVISKKSFQLRLYKGTNQLGCAYEPFTTDDQLQLLLSPWEEEKRRFSLSI